MTTDQRRTLIAVLIGASTVGAFGAVAIAAPSAAPKPVPHPVLTNRQLTNFAWSLLGIEVRQAAALKALSERVAADEAMHDA